MGRGTWAGVPAWIKGSGRKGGEGGDGASSLAATEQELYEVVECDSLDFAVS